MKRTQVIELFATIKASFVSFFSIMMFVALGAGVFLGIIWMAPALQTAAEKTFDAGSFHHFQIQFPYGLTREDIEKLSAVDDVNGVETGYICYQTFTFKESENTAKMMSLPALIDVLSVVDGTLPTRPNEIAVNATSAEALGLSVGDIITFHHDAVDSETATGMTEQGASNNASASAKAPRTNDNDGNNDEAADPDGMARLTNDIFTITALVNSPEFTAKSPLSLGVSPSSSGTVDVVAWAPAMAFDPAGFQDGFPLVTVRSDALARLNTFSNEYKTQSASIKVALNDLGNTLADERYQSLRNEAQAKIDDAETQLADARQQADDGATHLEEGRATLDSESANASEQLEEARQQLVASEKTYASMLAAYNKAQGDYDNVIATITTASGDMKELKSEKNKLDTARAEGSLTKKEYNTKLAALTKRANAALAPLKAYADAPISFTKDNFDAMMEVVLITLANAYDIPLSIDGRILTLNEMNAELVTSKAKLAEAHKKLEDGWAQYYAGKDELERSIADGESQLAGYAQKLEEGRQQIADGEQKIADSKEKIAQMTQYAWSVSDRFENGGIKEESTFASVTNSLSLSMATLFIIVGLLVSYSAVSRLVNERITQIGTKKALGLRSREITLSFLAYAAFAVLTGCVVGITVGVFLVEGIIGSVLAGRFTFGALAPYFSLPLALGVTALELVLILGATWLACRSILRRNAMDLLRGAEPPAAKSRFFETWGIWQKMPLYTQTIVNNCLNDKRRVFSTIVGVAGCAAIIVTAITLNNDVLKSYDEHYAHVYDFDAIAYIDSAVEGAADKTQAALDEQGCTTAAVIRTTMSLSLADGGRTVTYLTSPADADTFGQLFHLIALDGSEVTLDDSGAWVSQAYAEHTGAQVGDTITLGAQDGSVHKMPIAGFYRYGLTMHEIVMTRALYENTFGEAFAPNAILTNTGGEDFAALESTVHAIEGCDSLINDKAEQGRNFNSFASVSYTVVFIYLLLAAIMATVVLLNLNVMFIDEKKRELIVLMINGFSTKDAKRYITSDSIILTVVGIIVGVVLGCLMGFLTVASIEPDSASFIKGIDPMAIFIGAVGSLLLAGIMTAIALRRIPRFQLTDINRM